MDLGYTLLHRKFWRNSILQEKGKPFSRREAWLYLTNVLARGIDDPETGLKRGEFEASYRFLAQTWNWETTKVFRFFKQLEAESMLSRNPLSMQHPAQRHPQQEAQCFTICSYETYNPRCNTDRNTQCNTDRNKVKERIKEGRKERENTSQPAGAAAVDPSPSVESFQLSELLKREIAKRDPHSKAAKLPETTHWARDIDKIIRIDGRRAEDVEAVILWCQNNGCFWGPNIQSGRKLREKFDQMWGQMQQQKGNQRGRNPDLYVGQSDNAINPEDKQEKALHDNWPPDQASIDLWNSVLAIVETTVSRQSFDTWFKPIHLCCLRDGILHLTVPTKFFKDCLQENYAELINESVMTNAKHKLLVQITC
jgi:hypothetical protein